MAGDPFDHRVGPQLPAKPPEGEPLDIDSPGTHRCVDCKRGLPNILAVRPSKNTVAKLLAFDLVRAGKLAGWGLWLCEWCWLKYSRPPDPDPLDASEAA